MSCKYAHSTAQRTAYVNGKRRILVLLGAASSGVSVDGAKFVSGEEKLRTLRRTRSIT